MSYVQSIHHIIIRTKNNENTIDEEYSEELYRYIWGYIKNKKSFLYRINGITDHIHILVGIHPAISLSDFVKGVKTSTNIWMKENRKKFPCFNSWGEKYAAFSIRYQENEIVIDYIKNQREHHKRESFKDEYRRLIEESGIEIDDRYLFL